MASPIRQPRRYRILLLAMVGSSIFLATPQWAQAAPSADFHQAAPRSEALVPGSNSSTQTTGLIAQKSATTNFSAIAKNSTAASSCATVIILLAAGFYLSGYKWYRVLQAIRAVGGVLTVINAVLAKATSAERISEFSRIFGSRAADVLGISAIRENCGV